MNYDNQNDGQKDNFAIEKGNLSLDQKAAFLYKKTEKISKALFLVTQHLPDSVSLKRLVRDNTLQMLDIVSKVVFDQSPNQPSLSYNKSEVERILTLTLSLTDLSLSSGLMSFRNAQLITDNVVSYKNELAVFFDQLLLSADRIAEKDPSHLLGQNSLSDTFFEVSENEFEYLSNTKLIGHDFSDPIIENFNQAVSSVSPLTSTSNRNLQPDIISTKESNEVYQDEKGNAHQKTRQGQDIKNIQQGHASTLPTTVVQKNLQSAPARPQASAQIPKFNGTKEGLSQFFNSLAANPSNRQVSSASHIAANHATGEPSIKNDRQQTILNTIKEKGELSIKDLTDVIRGCSEKTIQRELISMVSTGILTKTGERRWSKYSLAA